jgi:hypothetical protein
VPAAHPWSDRATIIFSPRSHAGTALAVGAFLALLFAQVPAAATGPTTVAELETALCPGIPGRATVTLQQNITEDSAVLTVDTVAGDCKATLDLNGHTLTVSRVVLGAGADLTIRDTSTSANGRLIAEGAVSDRAGIQTTGATLRIESGTVSATGGDDGAGIGGGFFGSGEPVLVGGGSAPVSGSSASAGEPETPGEAAENAAALDTTVLELQRLLNSYGWRLAEDGTFGPRTRQAMFEFQAANSLERSEAPGETLAWAEGREDMQGRDKYLAQQPQAASSGGGGRVARLEQLADSVGFDWRSRGGTIHVGCSPIALRDYGRCTWALYEIESRRIFIAERIPQGSAREHYLVLHELAHAWQFTVRNWPQAASDVSDWGKHGMEGLEAAADCLALAWGAPTHHYWNCPADAQAHMLALYNSTTG